MHTPPLYRLARWLARFAATAYFRRIEITGRSQVPDQGPVILAANHPQSVLDALVLGVASPRAVHYLAHSGLFASKWKALFLRASGVIPIHRRSEVENAASKNESSFVACRKVLEKSGCIGIFPEGTSQQERRVLQFKTGTARIALDAESSNDFKLGVQVVPVGLSFQSARRFRSRVLVTFGEPVRANAFAQTYTEQPEQAVRDFTAELQERVRFSVVDVGRPELEEFIQQVEGVYKGELLEREGLKVPGASRFKRDQTLSREIAKATEYFYETRPELIMQARGMLEEYNEKLDQLRLPDRMIREEGEAFRVQAIRSAIRFTVGAPFAFWGTLFNYLPYRATDLVAHRKPRDGTKTHLMQLYWGAFFFVSMYTALFFLAYSRMELVTVLLLLASLPPTGIFARAYWAHGARSRRQLRFAWIQSTRSWIIQEVKTMRQEIIELMDEAMDEYIERQRTEETE